MPQHKPPFLFPPPAFGWILGAPRLVGNPAFENPFPPAEAPFRSSRPAPPADRPLKAAGFFLYLEMACPGWPCCQTGPGPLKEEMKALAHWTVPP